MSSLRSCVRKEVNECQAERPISTGKLNPLRDLHILPINLVVFKESSKPKTGWEILSWSWLGA